RARKKFVQGAEAATGKNQLPADLWIAALHEAQQFNLLLGVWCKIGVAAFGRHDAVTIAMPNKHRLTEARARSQQSASATGLGFAFVQHQKLFWIEIFDALPPCAKVIQ